MADISFDNRRIAKNTLMLYFRQFITMLVSLYTSRVVLDVLGVVDYGIYNVVGGIVVMFSFISATLSTASQRYIAYDLPKYDSVRLRQTFSLILLSYIIVSLIIFVMAEAVGIWFLNTHMTIPDSRLNSANIVLQASIVSFLVGIVAAPYMSVIIAHEKMTVYAYVSIVEAVLKLLALLFLRLIPYDGMVTYSILVAICSIIISFSYRYYCKGHFPECHFSFYYDKTRLKEIVGFAWWNTLGALANVLRGQGINIILNIFFNPVINAARAISIQVGGAVSLFANNFYTASRSQIIMSYSNGDLRRMHFLVIQSSRFVILLLTLLIIPIIVNVNTILGLWLVNPPSYAGLFVALMLVCTLIEAPLGSLLTGVQATGKMKEYNLTISIISLLNIPFSFILLKDGFPPESVFYISIGLAVIAIPPRLFLSHKFYGLSILDYLRRSFLWGLAVAVLCWIFAYYTNNQITQTGVFADVIKIVISLFETIVIVFFLGLTFKERRIVISNIKRYARCHKTHIL